MTACAVVISMEDWSVQLLFFVNSCLIELQTWQQSSIDVVKLLLNW